MEIIKRRPGGKQAGAGRKPGTKNLATIERELRARSGVASAVNNGLLPLDVMLAKLRNEALPDGTLPTDAQFQAAVAAAPYVHPRLAATDTTMRSDNVHRVVADKPMTEEQWVNEHADNDATVPPVTDEAKGAA